MQEELKLRTKNIVIEIIKLIDSVPNTISGRAIANQIIRSATSIGANYRAACRAKSTADFVNKLKIVEEEADETMYWLEIIEESQLLKSTNIDSLKKEINEIISIVVSSIKTLRNKENSKIVNQKS
ncbi:MAG: four helix bundle protein [Bacteroidota bacterium]|nr:four helix bundle protein [Bacteroidota bacterium]